MLLGINFGHLDRCDGEEVTKKLRWLLNMYRIHALVAQEYQTGNSSKQKRLKVVKVRLNGISAQVLLYNGAVQKCLSPNLDKEITFKPEATDLNIKVSEGKTSESREIVSDDPRFCRHCRRYGILGL